MQESITISTEFYLELLKKEEQLEKAKEALRLVNDHAESCAIFIYDDRGCNCFYKLCKNLSKELEGEKGEE